jgi:uncharacterized protein with PQ loop repeat
MSWWGWTGGALSVVQLLPQIRLLCRTKSGTQISRAALSIRVVGYAMYLVHATNIGDPPLFYMTLVGLVLLSIIILQCTYFDVWLVYRARQSTTESTSGTSKEGIELRLDQSTEI